MCDAYYSFRDTYNAKQTDENTRDHLLQHQNGSGSVWIYLYQDEDNANLAGMALDNKDCKMIRLVYSGCLCDNDGEPLNDEDDFHGGMTHFFVLGSAVTVHSCTCQGISCCG